MSETALDIEVTEQTVVVEVRETALDVAITESVVEVSQHESVIEALLSGPMGPQGASGTGAALEIPFAYGDATPKFITTAASGKLVYEASVLITETFNGAGAALVIGDAGIADRLLAATENDPGTLGTYTTHPNIVYLVDTVINLTITPGAGASQGAGLLTLAMQQ